MVVPNIYATDEPPNHITLLRSSHRTSPSKASYGLDSPLGLLSSNVLAPLYLYASLKGKFDIWDKLLEELPIEIFSSPALDVGCGRGLVLLKIARKKKDAILNEATAVVAPVYGVDLFIKGDQSGNAPEATFDNAASLGLLDQVILHTVDFTNLPFKDETIGLVTASLSIHNADKAARQKAIAEVARVLRPGGFLIILELMGYIAQYRTVLASLGWREIHTQFGGLRVMFGAWPCQILHAVKPEAIGRGNEDTSEAA